MLKDGTFHQDLGADHFIKRDKARIAAVCLRSPLSIIPAEISFRLFRNVHHHRF
jgi:hypothetical protein